MNRTLEKIQAMYEKTRDAKGWSGTQNAECLPENPVLERPGTPPGKVRPVKPSKLLEPKLRSYNTRTLSDVHEVVRWGSHTLEIYAPDEDTRQRQHFNQAVIDLEPHREALGMYWRLTCCLTAAARLQNPNAAICANELNAFATQKSLALYCGGSLTTLEKLLRHSPAFLYFCRLVGWDAWTTTVSSKGLAEGKNWKGGTVFTIRRLPLPEGQAVRVRAENMKHQWRDLNADIENKRTVKALEIPLRPPHARERNLTTGSRTPRQEEYFLLNQLHQTSIIRTYKNGDKSDPVVRNESRTFHVTDTIFAPIPTDKQGLHRWVNDLAYTLEGAMGDSSRWRNLWRGLAWKIAQAFSFGLGEMAIHAQKCLAFHVHDVLERSRDNPKVKSRGAILQAALKADPSWAGMLEAVSAMKVAA
jgi:hypothetical protein